MTTLATQHRRASFVPIYFVFFLDNFGFSLVFTIFGPLLLYPEFGFFTSHATVGVRNLMIGILFAAFPLAQLFGAPIIGDLADHYGRKKAFTISIAGSIIGYILSAIAILTQSFSLLLISRLLTGIVAGNLTLCLAAIADLSPTESSRGRHYGFIAVVAGVSWIVAMLAGGYLSDKEIYRYFNPALPFLVTAFLSVLALWAVAALFKETRPTRMKKLTFNLSRGFHNVIESFKIKEVRWLYLVYFFWVVGWGATVQWFTPFSIERFHVNQVEILWILVLFGLSWSIGGSLINWFILKYWGSAAISKVTLAINTIFVLGAAFCYYYEFFTWLYVISAAFAGVAMSNLLNLISLSAPANMQGKVMGLSQSTMALGWIIGPILGGLITDYMGIDIIFFFAALFILIAFILMLYDTCYMKRISGVGKK
ncbi:MAG: MFS transporter [Rhabdochlamydiaceae bacterium]|nr:MFS transporter [Candidatus Amphrikana amoebophyrae]